MKNFKNSYHTDKPFFSPPETVEINGAPVPIRWDFKTAFRFMEYVDGSEDEDEVFLQRVLEIWYPHIPSDRDAALDAAIRFYCGGSDPKQGYYEPLVDPNQSKEGIYLHFLKNYGIDLNRDTVHWWVFRRLMEGIRERRKEPWIESKSYRSQTANFLN